MTACDLCDPAHTLLQDAHAYVAHEKSSLSKGHVIVAPKRHVADFFEMTSEEHASVLGLLVRAKDLIQGRHAPDGYNVGINIGKAAGQSRMHVHVHLIPRYAGDVPDPKGGIRCVLAKR